MKLRQTIPIMLLFLIFVATTVFATQPIRKLQATKTLPRENQAIEKMAKENVPNPRAQRLSVKDLGRKKIKKATKTLPRENQAIEKMAKERIPKSREKRLSVNELKEKLKNSQKGREKLEMINRGHKPTSSLSMEKEFSLAWLNPFTVSEVQAGAFSVTLDYTNSFLAGYNIAYSHMYNVILAPGSYHRNVPTISNHYGKLGHAGFLVKIPTEGWYLINVNAGGQGQAKLDHSGTGTLESWDFTTSSSYWNDHLTAEYLSAGTHVFYFKPAFNRTGYVRINRITIDSFY